MNEVLIAGLLGFIAGGLTYVASIVAVPSVAGALGGLMAAVAVAVSVFWWMV